MFGGDLSRIDVRVRPTDRPTDLLRRDTHRLTRPWRRDSRPDSAESVGSDRAAEPSATGSREEGVPELPFQDLAGGVAGEPLVAERDPARDLERSELVGKEVLELVSGEGRLPLQLD